jgi:hypothetical protein
MPYGRYESLMGCREACSLSSHCAHSAATCVVVVGVMRREGAGEVGDNKNRLVKKFTGLQ